MKYDFIRIYSYGSTMVVPNLSMVVGMSVVFGGVATSQKLSLLPW
jgi:hypothetical protein